MTIYVYFIFYDHPGLINQVRIEKSDFHTHLLSAARGPGRVLKLSQQAWVEPSHQTGFGVHVSKMWQPYDFQWLSRTMLPGKMIFKFHDFPGPIRTMH